MTITSDAAAERLLTLMRDPGTVITGVEEHCHVGRHRLERKLQISVAPDGLGPHETLFLDVMHPRKGVAETLSLEEGSPHSIVSHDEHLAISRQLIAYRFGTLLSSVIVDAAREAWLVTELMKVLQDVLEIPGLPPRRAAKVLSRHFTAKRGRLRVLKDAGAVYEESRMVGLYRLCARLVERYLVLVEIAPSSSDSRTVSFSYVHRWSGEDVPRATRWSGLRPTTWVGAPLPSSRIHIPWAKRTDHYVFQITAPENYFFGSQALLAKEGEELLALSPDDEVGFSWSLNHCQGRASRVFVGGATAFRRQLYVALRAFERPGESTARMLFVAGVATLVLSSFLVWVYFADDARTTSALASVVLAVLALGSISSLPSSGPGVLGFPVLSRAAPRLIGVLTIMFAFWLQSRQTGMDGDVIASPWVRDAVRSVWQVWLAVGGVAIVTASALLSVVLFRRYRHLLRRYETINAIGPAFRIEHRRGGTL